MAVLTLFGQTGNGSNPSDATGYTMGVQFSVSVSGATLTGIWFYSGSWATVLPQTIILYTVAGPTTVHSESASWSGAAGSGWVRAAFSSPPSLTSGTAYKAAVMQNTAANWYSVTSHYWDSGAGSGGITNGALSAPNNAGGDGGQDTFTVSTPAYPNTSFNASNYWVDPEVTTSGASHSATVTSTATPSTAMHRGIGKALAVTVHPAAAVARAHQTGRTIAATVTPATVVQVAHKRAKGGGYYDYHHRAAQR